MSGIKAASRDAGRGGRARALGWALLLLLLCAPAWGLDGKKHAKLWNEVFGIADKESQEAVQPLWDVAQEVIDGYLNDYHRMRKKFPWFNLGRYGHRLLFHWGFNAAPQRYPPLKDQVGTCLKDTAKDRDPSEAETWRKDQERDFFRYLTREVQATRNRNLINAVVRTTGIPTARGYANAVATILYDVHLLGDYTTPAASGLPRLKMLEDSNKEKIDLQI